MKDVRLPQDLQRAMAAEAEASREARAKVIKIQKIYLTEIKVWRQVIAAEGEQKASRALKEASDIITESAAALQLRQFLQWIGIQSCSFFFRYLQTLTQISAEKNSTIIFPLPLGKYLFRFLQRHLSVGSTFLKCLAYIQTWCAVSWVKKTRNCW